MTHRRLSSIAALAALALVLAACQITVTPPTPTFPPTVAGTVEAEVFVPTLGEPPTSLLSATVDAQQTRYYRVQVPAARELLYAEVNGDSLRVTIYTAAGTTLAVSESSQYFGPNAASLSASGAVSGSSLSVSFLCAGPCAAVEPSATTYVVGVRNLANSPRQFDLFAYTMDATDLGEPNDAAGNPVSVAATDDPVGAIEWLGDEDWYRYVGGTEQTLRFTVYNLGLDLVLQFQSDGTVVEGSLGTGTSALVFPNDVFRVYSASGLAGPSAESRYLITIE